MATPVMIDLTSPSMTETKTKTEIETETETVTATVLETAQCGICLEKNIIPCTIVGKGNSIQCNKRFGTFACCFGQAPTTTPASESEHHEHHGCKQWFHKACLRPWHYKKTKEAADSSEDDDDDSSKYGTSCPGCRATHSFVWSFEQDFSMKNCIFQEDFLQYALVTGSLDAVEVKALVEKHGMCVNYANEVEFCGVPEWILCARKHGSLLANAVAGSSLDTLKYLIDKGARLPTWRFGQRNKIDGINGEYEGEDEDMFTDEQMYAKRDTLVKLAAKRYARRAEDRAEAFAIFRYLLDYLDCDTIMDKRVKVVYPHEEDVLLYVIRMGFGDLLEELLPRMLDKHSSVVLLQWSLKAGREAASNTFALLVSALTKEYANEPKAMEQALLTCARVPNLDRPLLDMVYAVLPAHLRTTFMVKVTETMLKLCNRDALSDVLFRPQAYLLEELGVQGVNELLIAVSQVFMGQYRAAFDFQIGFRLVSKPFHHESYKGFLRKLLSPVESLSVPGSKPERKRLLQAETAAIRLLRRPDDEVVELLVERRVRANPWFRTLNIIELLLIKFRVVGSEAPAEVVHELLFRSLSSFTMSLEEQWVKEACYVDKFIAHIIAPIVAYVPTCLHVAAGDRNVLLYAATKGLWLVNRRVFQKYTPDYRVTNKHKQNSLHLAIHNEQVDMAKYLLNELGGIQRNTVDKGAVDSKGRTPLMLCAMQINYDVKVGSKRKRDRRRSKPKQMLAVAKDLLKHEAAQAMVNHQDVDGNTALHHAYMSGNVELGKLVEGYMSSRAVRLANSEGFHAADFNGP